MITIWKYDLEPDRNNIEMPSGAKVLSIQVQRGNPVMWALVDTEKEVETRRFAIYETGHNIPVNCGNYLGTFQVENETFVFHVFEEKL